MDSSGKAKLGEASSPPALPSSSSLKRSAPSLLPAFEPVSSPAFPRPSKRQARGSSPTRAPSYKYPTPIPTSTTGILSSSPQRNQGSSSLEQGQPAVSLGERAPLSAVPSVTLPLNGHVLLMGRSSNTSHYQLGANRLISRVHVKTRYISSTTFSEPNKIEVNCTGWNGLKLHCQGRTWELAKGDSFTSETEGAEIMIDVQDARVMLVWPELRHQCDSDSSSESWDEGVGEPDSPTQNRGPVRAVGRMPSPESPTPGAATAALNGLSELVLPEPGLHNDIQIYEDPENADDAQAHGGIALDQSQISTLAATSFLTDPSGSQSSELSDPEDEEDPNEENDPIVHSFGPFGANISSRMASMSSGSPRSSQQKSDVGTKSPHKRSFSEASTDEAPPNPITTHVVNQLAFSRLSSTPLSDILNHLPLELKRPGPIENTENPGLTKWDLRQLLDCCPCVGEIIREGKDAAGKPLEPEYYYVPSMDTDEDRRRTVAGLNRPSLRNCRKQHKQYYWKRPRTP